MAMTRKDLLKTFEQLDNEAIMELTAQKNKHDLENIRNAVNPYNGDTEWELAISDKFWAKCNTLDGQLGELRQRLLDIGGVETVLPVIEEDIDNILAYGQLWDNVTKKMIIGRPSKCHVNASELWYNNKNKESFKVAICTGYALSADGIWRQHSWLIQCKPRSNVLIETTEDRLAYYGFAMTYRQAEEFEYNNS